MRRKSCKTVRLILWIGCALLFSLFPGGSISYSREEIPIRLRYVFDTQVKSIEGVPCKEITLDKWEFQDLLFTDARNGFMLVTVLKESPAIVPGEWPQRFYILLRTGDGGRSWKIVLACLGPNEDDTFRSFRLAALEPGHICLFRDSFLMSSLDNGETWGCRGFPERFSIWSVSGSAGEWVVNGKKGMNFYGSSDRGRTWNLKKWNIPDEILKADHFFLFHNTPYMARGDRFYFLRGNTIYSSQGAGKPWSKVCGIPTDPTSGALEFLPGGTDYSTFLTDFDCDGRGAILIHGEEWSSGFRSIDGSSDVCLSSRDGGRTWERHSTLEVLRRLSGDGKKTEAEAALFDDFFNEKLHYGMGIGTELKSTILKLPTTIYALTGDTHPDYEKGMRIYWSPDTGKTWSLLSPGDSRIIAFRAPEGAIRAITDGNELLSSDDGGKSWERIPVSIMNREKVQVLSFEDPDHFPGFEEFEVRSRPGKIKKEIDLDRISVDSIKELKISGHNDMVWSEDSRYLVYLMRERLYRYSIKDGMNSAWFNPEELWWKMELGPLAYGGSITFACYGRPESDAGFAIWGLDPEKGMVKRLSPPGIRAQYPSLSPDHRYLAYAGGKFIGGPPRIMVTDLLKGKTKVICDAFAQVMWSPDGKWILGNFRKGYEQTEKIQIISPDNCAARDIGWGISPSWSPGGKYIMFGKTSDDGKHFSSAGGKLFITDIEKMHTREIELPCPGLEKTGFTSARWSPDGQYALLSYIVNT